MAGYALSIWLLAVVVRQIPVSVAYAVWSGAGTALVATAGFVFLGERLDLVKVGNLAFEAPDLERFPALALAQEALRAGGARPAILNAANEIAVEAFLLSEIGFLDIASIAAETLEGCDTPAPETVEEVLAIDSAARAAATGIKQRFVK